jgi:ribosomal protein S18 acetylase RimI-like enzyme
MTNGSCKVRSLQPGDFAAVHAAFLDAFSDYAVPFRISAADLVEMLRRRGYVPDASVGVFDGDRLVAFTLNGLGEWNGRRTGYDSGTGVVPSHRGRGLSRLMLDASIERLRDRGAAQYLLEVLQGNERAFCVYRNAGFAVTREFQCWRMDAGDPADAMSLEPVDWKRVSSFFDAPPSWQNSIDSIRRAAAPRTNLSVPEGCAVVFDNGDLALLAVDRASRRRGIGTKLLKAAAAGRALRILNVDTSLAGAEAFLASCGAVKTVMQFEMLRPI